MLERDLDLVFEAVARQLVSSSDLHLNCLKLRANTKQVLQIANNYNFREIEANGFLTFSRLVIRFGRLVLETHVTEEDNLFSISRVLLKGVELCQQFASRDPMDLFASPPEDFISLLEVFGSMTPQLDVIYGHFCSYWLCQSMRRTMTGFTTLMAVYSASPNWWQSSRKLWSRTSRAQTVAHIAQNANVEFVKSFWGLTENRVIRRALPKLASSPKVCRDILVHRQNYYVISGETVLTNEKAGDCGDVRCRLLANEVEDCDSVVLHIHGGGFVSQSPDSHEVYLRDWSQKLKSSAILSVDYCLSPENKFPKALQQILDVYLWLTSSECEQELGFHPKDIVVCGDSAGGNLSLALVLVVHKMRALSPGLRSPKAVLSFYAPLILQTRASPSRLMTAVDTLLPLGVLLSCLEAYAPTERTQEDFEHIRMEDIPEDSAQWTPDWSLQWRHSLWTLKERLIGEEVPQFKPWYRQNRLRARLNAVNSATNNPFVSPLLARDLPKNIPLYLIGLHYDACLDDTIQMAKKWEGPVVVDIIDELPHGFLNFVMLSEEGRRASNLCLDRIKQSLI